ncbi:amidohydrolase [Sporosarcina sp. Te-1]|uniref:amidohydrolase n=1 Tax=Sporosarcina sp. Te-1 TaxID=2818390 RepID=UPI001A9EEDF2|nr:amidohydrolase [Sporosarcina sp. Te-1]QTD42527.1 amidohydrolase family protein [Sporosarcina sp. Te-1]
MASSYWLTNVLLENGYQFDNDVITGTLTETFHLHVEDGRIAKIVPANIELHDKLPKKNAGNLLALPSFAEKHVHLDKTLLGDQWRAVTPASSIFERFEIEKRVLPLLPTTTKERAKALIETLIQAGTTHIRSHVDIYPEVGLANLYAVQEALSDYEDMLSYEIVAFPQHGLLRSNSQELVRQAVRQGATLVGGVDPATVDGNMEKSLQEMMDIAVEGNVDIDLHLHDPGQLGLATIKRLAKLTEEAGWQGRVTVSHAFALGDMAGREADDIAHMLSELGISIITSVPIGRVIPPVNFLHDKGVPVSIACDNIFDSWSPFGNGDTLERASRFAELSGRVTEFKLAETLGFITDGITPLNKAGERVWPQVGDDANIVLVEASCSAEAVARRANRPAVLYKGKIVSGELKQ